jgi:hypothetical protein
MRQSIQRNGSSVIRQVKGKQKFKRKIMDKTVVLNWFSFICY